MALSEQQRATYDELRAKQTLTKSERGRLLAVRLSGGASPAEDGELLRLIGDNPLLPAAVANDGRPSSTPSGSRRKGESLKDAGRRLAEKQGWIRPPDPDAA